METLLTKSISGGLLTILIVISGILLRRSGKPYKTSIITIHKITVVGVIVLVILIYIQHLKVMQFSGFGLFLSIFSYIFLLIAFISGVLLSFDKFFYIRLLHRVSSWIILLLIPVIWWYCH